MGFNIPSCSPGELTAGGPCHSQKHVQIHPENGQLNGRRKSSRIICVQGHQTLPRSLSGSELAAGRTPRGSIAGRINYSCDLPSAFTTGYIWRQDVGPDGQWARPAEAALMHGEAELKTPRNAEQAVDSKSPCRPDFKTHCASRPHPTAACAPRDGCSPSEPICLPLISPKKNKNRAFARSGPESASFAAPSAGGSTPLQLPW